jgi:ATP-dependent RNA helicase
VVNEFRKGDFRILLTSFVIKSYQLNPALIINYDTPNSLDIYFHRIGKSGKFGRRQTVINFFL